MSRIGKVVDGLEPDALRRILDAPLEAWDFMRYAPAASDPFCARCFVGHVLDLRKAGDSLVKYRWVPDEPPFIQALRIAEGSVLKIGVWHKARLIRAIKIRALKALELRIPDCAVPLHAGAAQT